MNLCQVLILRKWYNHIDKPSSDGTQEHIKSSGGETISDNQRYITRGIDAEIPLWLQVFELNSLGGMQRIIHFSEQPEYRMNYFIPTNKALTAKVYIIDSDEYSTMLLASEY